VREGRGAPVPELERGAADVVREGVAHGEVTVLVAPEEGLAVERPAQVVLRRARPGADPRQRQAALVVGVGAGRGDGEDRGGEGEQQRGEERAPPHHRSTAPGRAQRRSSPEAMPFPRFELAAREGLASPLPHADELDPMTGLRQAQEGLSEKFEPARSRPRAPSRP
jgi:hypothetical protein